MILFESILLLTTIAAISIFATLKATKHVNNTPPMDLTDIKLMSLLTLVFAIIAFFNLGTLHSPTANWNAQPNNSTLTINLNKPTSVATIYYYTGISDGKFHWSYQTSMGENGTYVDPNSSLGYPAHYKWNKFFTNNTQPISTIQLSLDSPQLEIKQIALFIDFLIIFLAFVSFAIIGRLAEMNRN